MSKLTESFRAISVHNSYEYARADAMKDAADPLVATNAASAAAAADVVADAFAGYRTWAAGYAARAAAFAATAIFSVDAWGAADSTRYAVAYAREAAQSERQWQTTRLMVLLGVERIGNH